MKWKGEFMACILIGIFYAGMFALGITCPIKFLTGISCLGCGLTRAWISALCLDFPAAFSYHPMFWSVPILLATLLWNRNMRQVRWIAGVGIALFALTYLCRLMLGDGDVVVWDPSGGFVFRTMHLFLN